MKRMEIANRTEKLISAGVLMSLLLLVAGCTGPEEQPLIDEDAVPEVLTEGYEFTEGPYWHEDGYLLFSDIPANRVYQWTPGEGAEVFLDPSGNANGIQADVHGSLLLAQHAGRVSRVTEEGELEVLVDSYEGSRLNSPNDLTVHSTNTIYFTDPPFGVSEEDRELDFSGVYRYSPDGELTLIYNEFNRPNGIVLSPDESRLYINDSETGNIVVLDVDPDGQASNPQPFASVGPSNQDGAADGMALDMDGRLYSTGPAGLSIFDTDGTHLRDIPFPQRISNLKWGGDNHNELYITSVDRVFRLEFNVTGYKPR